MKATLVDVCIDEKIGFKGNRAAVIRLDKVLDPAEMQSVAKKLNQPATTFLWEENGAMQVRWFAPDAEIGLCGHGSLAAFPLLERSREARTLHYKTGVLSGYADDHFSAIALDEISVIEELSIPLVLKEGLGVPIKAYFKTNNKNIVLLSSEADLKRMQPDFAKLRESETFGYTVTTEGHEVDFVSRTLVPHVQQLEDHATGSSHAALVPFWSKRLSKKEMLAHQLSPNGGKFWCTYEEPLVNLKVAYKILDIVTL
jgi:PhzF family phenazine biosynthesis protein